MSVDKTLLSGSTSMLLLKLLEEKDLYGYEMIESLRARSNNVFELKAWNSVSSAALPGRKGLFDKLRKRDWRQNPKILFHYGGRKKTLNSKRKNGMSILRQLREFSLFSAEGV